MQGKVFEKNMITQIQRTDYTDKDLVLICVIAFQNLRNHL